MNPDFLTTAFSAVVELSWRSGWLIVVLLILRRLIGTRVPARVWHVAWLAVAMRLFLPLNLPVSWPTFGWVRALETPAPLSASAMSAAQRAPAPTTAEVALDQSGPMTVERAPLALVAQKTVELGREQPAPALSPRTREPGPAWTAWQWAALAWATGVVMLVGMRALAGWRLRAQLKDAVVLDDPRLQRGIRRYSGGVTLTCLETEAVTAPALYGLFRVRLLFPRGMIARLDDAELALVLRHELGHWQRLDLWAQTLVHVAVIVHWFNPLAWWLARRAREDCELACDETVLRNETDGGQAYGAVLLKVLGMANTQRDTPLSAVGIVGGRSQLVQRIKQVAAFRPASTWWVAGAALMLGMLLVASATRETRAQTDSTATSAIADNSALRVLATTDGGSSGAAPAPDISVSLTTDPDAQPVVLVAPTSAVSAKISLSAGVPVPVAVAMPAPQPVALAEWVSTDVRMQQIREYRERGQDLSNLPFVASDPLVQALTHKLVEQRIRLKELEQRYAERHPQIVGITHTIQETEKELLHAVQAVCMRIEAEQEAVQQQRRLADKKVAAQSALDVTRLNRELIEKEQALRSQQQQIDELQRRLSGDASRAGDSRQPRVSVLGAVNHEGIVPGPTAGRFMASEAISRAGGFSRYADAKAVRLVRREKNGMFSNQQFAFDTILSGRADKDIELQDGDLLFVPQRSVVRTISVAGCVAAPGRHRLDDTGSEKFTLIDALAAAGGPTALADMHRVRVVRQAAGGGEGEVTVYDLSGVFGAAGRSGSAPLPAAVELQSGDVIYVPERII